MKYESVWSKRKQKNNYTPKKFTIISQYREDIDHAIDYISRCFYDKGYALLGNFSVIGCFDLIDDYGYDELQKFGWDKYFFDIDNLYVRKNERGFYYVELEAPMKMSL